MKEFISPKFLLATAAVFTSVAAGATERRDETIRSPEEKCFADRLLNSKLSMEQIAKQCGYAEALKKLKDSKRNTKNSQCSVDESQAVCDGKRYLRDDSAISKTADTIKRVDEGLATEPAPAYPPTRTRSSRGLRE